MILVKKGLKLLSVLMIVLGLLTLAVGIMTTGIFVLSGETTAEVKSLIALTLIFSVANGLLEFVGGALGLRAAKNPAKSLDAVIFGFVALAVGVCSLVLDFSVQNICACIIPLLYFVCALEVHREPLH